MRKLEEKNKYIDYLEDNIDVIKQKLTGLIYNFNFNGDLPDDIVQDIVLKVIEKIDTFQGKSKLESWIFSIARNYCINLKKRKREIPVDFIESFQESPAAFFCPLADNYIEQELRERIKEEISQLPEKFRDIILLYYYKNLSQDEIARKLQIPLGTVWSRMNTTRRILKEKIAVYV